MHFINLHGWLQPVISRAAYRPVATVPERAAAHRRAFAEVLYSICFGDPPPDPMLCLPTKRPTQQRGRIVNAQLLIPLRRLWGADADSGMTSARWRRIAQFLSNATVA
jgi:hypothetical protein